MDTKKSTKHTIKGFSIGLAFIGLALLFSFIFLSGIDVKAQTMQQERVQDRRENRQERREDRQDACQGGYA